MIRHSSVLFLQAVIIRNVQRRDASDDDSGQTGFIMKSSKEVFYGIQRCCEEPLFMQKIQ